MSHYPLRYGELLVDSRPIPWGVSSSRFRLADPTKPGPSSGLRMLAKAFGLFILLLFLIPLLFFLAFAIAVYPGAAAATIAFVGILALVIASVFFGARFLVGSGGTYVVTSWRAMIVDRNGKVLHECYLKDAVAVPVTYTVTHRDIGSHPKGDIDFQSSGTGAFLMKFADVDYPEELERKINLAQNTRLALCKACHVPMSGPNANYCAVCGTKQS